MKRFKVTINDKEYAVGVQELDEETIAASPREPARPAVVPASAPLPVRNGTGQVCSPIPGIVVSILVDVGTRVHKGEILLILEAMKMENDIMSTKDGVVSDIKVKEGQPVDANDVLLLID